MLYAIKSFTTNTENVLYYKNFQHYDKFIKYFPKVKKKQTRKYILRKKKYREKGRIS